MRLRVVSGGDPLDPHPQARLGNRPEGARNRSQLPLGPVGGQAGTQIGWQNHVHIAGDPHVQRGVDVDERRRDRDLRRRQPCRELPLHRGIGLRHLQRQVGNHQRQGPRVGSRPVVRELVVAAGTVGVIPASTPQVRGRSRIFPGVARAPDRRTAPKPGVVERNRIPEENPGKTIRVVVRRIAVLHARIVIQAVLGEILGSQLRGGEGASPVRQARRRPIEHVIDHRRGGEVRVPTGCRLAGQERPGQRWNRWRGGRRNSRLRIERITRIRPGVGTVAPHAKWGRRGVEDERRIRGLDRDTGRVDGRQFHHRAHRVRQRHISRRIVEVTRDIDGRAGTCPRPDGGRISLRHNDSRRPHAGLQRQPRIDRRPAGRPLEGHLPGGLPPRNRHAIQEQVIRRGVADRDSWRRGRESARPRQLVGHHHHLAPLRGEAGQLQGGNAGL